MVESDDQITHEASLNDTVEVQQNLDWFTYDPDYLQNEAEYDAIKQEILGDEEAAPAEDEEEGPPEDAEEEPEAQQQLIIDQTDIDTQNLKRVIYLTIMSVCTMRSKALGY